MIYLVIFNLGEIFLAACGSYTRAEEYINSLKIKHFAHIVEYSIEGLINDKLYVVSRIYDERFVYCTGNPIVGSFIYKVKTFTLLRY